MEPYRRYHHVYSAERGGDSQDRILAVEQREEDVGYERCRLDFTNEAVDFIADKGFDPQFGARPVKRVIQKYVLNELSKALLGGTVDRNRPIVIDRKDDGLEFKN